MIISGARTPLKMNDDDYGELCLEEKFFLGNAASLPNRPTHLVALQSAKCDAFVAALDSMNTLQNLMRSLSGDLDTLVISLDKKVRWMRNMLPTLTPGSSTLLVPFGLDKPVPRAIEELKNYADAANAHWQTVKLEPLYAPVKDACDELADLVSDFDDKRAAQLLATSNYSVAQNAKMIARSEHHLLDRAVFDAYVAFYPDQQDEYWTQTPWGKAQAEDMPVPGEPVGAFPAKVSNMNVKKANPPQNGAIVSCDPLGGVIGYNVCKAKVPTGMPRPTRPAEKWVFIEEPPVADTDVEIGFDYYYWICGVDENNVEGAWSDAMITWVG